MTSNSVEPSTIITTKLYCILSEDLKIENDNIKDFAIYVNAFKTYNKFDTENTENQNINVENTPSNTCHNASVGNGASTLTSWWETG